MSESTPTPAGLWPRVLAFGLDYLLILVYIVLLTGLTFLLRAIFPDVMAGLFSNPFSAQLAGFLMMTLPVSLYFALTEASTRQATWGKRRLGLLVVGPEVSRLGLGRSLARTLLKFLPWELAHFAVWQFSFTAGEPSAWLSGVLGLVWLLVGANVVSVLVSPARQALYDHLAGTRVLRTGPVEV